MPTPTVTTAAAEARPDRSEFVRAAGVVAELALLAFSAAWLRQDAPGLSFLIGVAAVGFIAHRAAGEAARPALLVAVSLIGGVFVVAFDEVQGALSAVVLLESAMFVAALALLALVFLAILRAPWPALARVATIVAAGALLAYLRSRQFLLSEAQWRIVGATFMFRLIVFAYEVISGRRKESWLDGLGYFLMLPTFHFALFPVVDYATFKRSRGGELVPTAQRGVNWMALGLLELALYRLVYHRVAVGPRDVDSFATLLRFVFPPYLLYLNVSGQFHLIVGMLHLFGLRLPETNRNWLLADSFTDFWRRINVYWKEFMVRVFYFPVSFRLRRRNEKLALIAATAAVFLATTVLHGYQAFWLRGAFSITAQDALFWGALGITVVFGILRESGRPVPRRTGFTPRRVLSIVGVWFTISLLWSIWSSPSLAEWTRAVTGWARP